MELDSCIHIEGAVCTIAANTIINLSASIVIANNVTLVGSGSSVIDMQATGTS